MASQNSRNVRQAVILIHGIGNQQPMDTLRGFMEGVHTEKWFSKPHEYSENLELRRFTTTPPYEANQPETTDFFEFYWAHHLDRGRALGTMGWATRLLFRWPFFRHTRQLFMPTFYLQLLGLLVVAAVGWNLWGVATAIREGGDYSGLYGVALWVLIGLIVFHFLISQFLRRNLADAPRYLTPSPANIRARNDIRAEGLRLLRALHESGDYQRIIVVGHSLGSVIGLDLLRMAWNELRHPDPDLADEPTVKAEGFDAVIDELFAGASATTDLDEWQQKQYELWQECRERGIPWLVTDFVTVGSPLAHADFLLDRPNLSFEQRAEEFEYPRCPPHSTSDISQVFYYRPYAAEDGEEVNALVAHSGAPFAITRWTNLYFPVRGISGDPVSGPLARHFGAGVRDIPVRVASLRRHNLFVLPGVLRETSRRVRPWKLVSWLSAVLRGLLPELFLVVHGHYWRRDLDVELQEPGTEEEQSAFWERRDQVDQHTNTRVSHEILADAVSHLTPEQEEYRTLFANCPEPGAQDLTAPRSEPLA